VFYLRLKALAAGAGKLASVVRGDARFAPTASDGLKNKSARYKRRAALGRAMLASGRRRSRAAWREVAIV